MFGSLLGPQPVQPLGSVTPCRVKGRHGSESVISLLLPESLCHPYPSIGQGKIVVQRIVFGVPVPPLEVLLIYNRWPVQATIPYF